MGEDGSAELGAERTVIEELGISLELPQGWRIRKVSTSAVLLIPSDERVRSVEIVTWTTPAPERTCELAVTGHEKLLAHRWRYERRTLEPFTTAAGWPGLAVTGTIATDDATTYTALFAAYVLPEGYLLIGTFYRPEPEQSVVPAIFGPLIASIGPASLLEAASPTSPPLSVRGPQTDRPSTVPPLTELPEPAQPPLSLQPQAPTRLGQSSTMVEPRPAPVVLPPETDRPATAAFPPQPGIAPELQAPAQPAVAVRSAEPSRRASLVLQPRLVAPALTGRLNTTPVLLQPAAPAGLQVATKPETSLRSDQPARAPALVPPPPRVPTSPRPIPAPLVDRPGTPPEPLQPRQPVSPSAPPGPPVPTEADQPLATPQWPQALGPAGPTLPTLAEEEWVERALSEGLTAKLPARWAAQLARGVFHGYDPARPQGIVVCPLVPLPVGKGEQTTQTTDTQTVLAYCQELIGATLSGTRERHVRRGNTEFDIITGRMRLGTTDNVSTIVVVARAAEVVMFSAAYAAEAQFERVLPHLRRILASVSIARLTAAVPELLRELTQTWTSPDGQLTLELPAGWQARGGVSEYHGHIAIDFEGYFAGPPRLWLAWQQPHTPFFRELTPLLRGYGRLPGQPYQERAAESPLLIMSRLPPAQFVTQYLITRAPPSWEQPQVSREVSYASALNLLEGRAASGTMLEIEGRSVAGPFTATYLLGMADLPIVEGSFRWQTAYLMWAGPSDFKWAAQRALHTVVSSAQVNAVGADAAELTKLVISAQDALPQTEELAPPRLVPLLAPAFRPQAAGTIRVPGSLLSYWQATSD